MPNWCENILNVEGDAADVDKFYEENKGIEVGPLFGLADGETRELPLSFEQVVSTPRNEDGTLIGEGPRDPSEPYKTPDWYDWRVKNWGTKWDLSADTDVNPTETGLEYRFDTAWSPPVEWLEKASAKYPTLDFTLYYREEGMAFEGEAEASNGKITTDVSWELDFDVSD